MKLRIVKPLLLTLAVLILTTTGCSTTDTSRASIGHSSNGGDHFDPKGNLPSVHTINILNEARQSMPFSDRRDFEEASKGFIAAPASKKIQAEAGHTAWDLERYNFLLKDKQYASIHPSLQRQSELNMNFGLYKVMPGIYQVRGFDLANITFIEGKTGWIVFDPLTAKETAEAAMKLVDENLGKKKVSAVIYSHSHADHFGGVRGIINEADVKAGRVQVIAPDGFLEHAVSENVFAGNAMNRRLFYQYGVLLPASPYGHVGQGLGQNVAAGNIGLIAPTRLIKKPYENITVDGVKMIFQNTPGTEAPSEMNTYIPSKKALWMAENVTGTIHNIYTLRGAPVRDALRWSKYINETLYKFGQEADVVFASHHWPRFGNERIQEIFRAQRDAYANLNNQVLYHTNRGVTINEIHNVYEVPQSLQDVWAARGYHGSPEHNSRGVVNHYIGYWDANPATLIPLSPRDSAPLYVEMMGGSRKVIREGRSLYNDGEYLKAQEIVNKLVFAEPKNQEGKDLLGDIFEQLGYQQENPGLRNSYLAAAFELRSGIPSGASPDSGSADVIQAMTTEMFLDFLGVRVDPKKADGMEFVINLITPDNGEKYVVEMSNGTLTNIKGIQAPDADLTIRVNRSDLTPVMMGQKKLDDQISAGKAKLDGDRKALEQLKSVLTQFEIGFEIMPGTKAEVAKNSELNTFQQDTRTISE